MKRAFPLICLALLTLACTRNQSPVETAAVETVAEMTTADKNLRHVVLFSFKEESSPEDVATVEAAFAALSDKIPEIKDFEWEPTTARKAWIRDLPIVFW